MHFMQENYTRTLLNVPYLLTSFLEVSTYADLRHMYYDFSFSFFWLNQFEKSAFEIYVNEMLLFPNAWFYKRKKILGRARRWSHSPGRSVSNHQTNYRVVVTNGNGWRNTPASNLMQRGCRMWDINPIYAVVSSHISSFRTRRSTVRIAVKGI